MSRKKIIKSILDEFCQGVDESLANKFPNVPMHLKNTIKYLLVDMALMEIDTTLNFITSKSSGLPDLEKFSTGKQLRVPYTEIKDDGRNQNVTTHEQEIKSNPKNEDENEGKLLIEFFGEFTIHSFNAVISYHLHIADRGDDAIEYYQKTKDIVDIKELYKIASEYVDFNEGSIQVMESGFNVKFDE